MFQSGTGLDTNGLSASRSDAGTPPLGSHGYGRTSRRLSPGQSDRSLSPISRTNTPGSSALHAHNANIAPQHLFDTISMNDHALNPASSLPPLHLRQLSPGSTPSAIDRHIEVPQSIEGLLAVNTSLKTRVSELEVINELFRGRVAELEQSDATARRSEMVARDSEARLRRSLDDAHQREEHLKRRISELEQQALDQYSGPQSGPAIHSNGPSEPSSKKIRLSDVVDYPSISPSRSSNTE